MSITDQINELLTQNPDLAKNPALESIIAQMLRTDDQPVDVEANTNTAQPVGRREHRPDPKGFTIAANQIEYPAVDHSIPVNAPKPPHRAPNTPPEKVAPFQMPPGFVKAPSTQPVEQPQIPQQPTTAVVQLPFLERELQMAMAEAVNEKQFDPQTPECILLMQLMRNMQETSSMLADFITTFTDSVTLMQLKEQQLNNVQVLEEIKFTQPEQPQTNEQEENKEKKPKRVSRSRKATKTTKKSTAKRRRGKDNNPG